MRIDLLDELFDVKSPESLGARWQARAYESVLVTWMLAFCWRWAREMRDFTQVIKPHGIAHHLDVSFLFGAGAYWNAALVSVGALLGATRVSPRLGYTLAMAGFHLQCVARCSQGKLFHGATFLGTGMLMLCVAMWLFENATDRRRFTMGASTFFFGLGYVSAAIAKLTKTGPSWVDGKHMWLWIGEKTVDALASTGSLQLSWVQESVLASHAEATAMLTVGLLSEALGFLLWFRRTRPFIALALIGMHVGIWMTMGISFEVNIAMLVLVALPWARFVTAVAPRSLELEPPRSAHPR